MKKPNATYRIQFNASFGFKEAAAIVDYLSDLGISAIFAAPIQKARKGSLHGYDIVEPGRLNPELGEWSDFKALMEKLRAAQMGWVQDIVPNHMAYDFDNHLLMDVLEKGANSEFYTFFDIDWEHPSDTIKGKVLAPFLGRHYSECLAGGEIVLKFDVQGFNITYYQLRFPVRIESYRELIKHGFAQVKRQLGEEHADFIVLFDVLEDLESLALQQSIRQFREKVVQIKSTLWDLYCHNGLIRECIDETLATYNGQIADHANYSLLDNLLRQQVFRLSHWKVACAEINYRRFFDINELICLRQERKEVFDRTHALVFEMIGEGYLTGLRVDHVDGLAYPGKYLERLRRRGSDLYLVVEKILEAREHPPAEWPIEGTTGYEFSARLNEIFIRAENEPAFTKVYASFTGLLESFEKVVYQSKNKVLAAQFSGEVENLIRALKKLSGWDRYGVDSAVPGLRRAVEEVLARFPVYRTYLLPEHARPEDIKALEAAIEQTVLHHTDLRHELMFLRHVLLGEDGYQSRKEDEARRCQRAVVITRFQQLTATLTAKGYEDTALYRYNRLLALNEVGAAPDRFGGSRDDFHRFIQKRTERWPYSMNATSTHDSKKGEDVRCRLDVLSELPTEWEQHLQAWHALNQDQKITIDRQAVPDNNEEYFLYQTLIGIWPLEEKDKARATERIKDYMIKAVREAKVHSSWLAPNEPYESALISFVENILSTSGSNRFIQRLMPFCGKIAWFGNFNTLAQSLIKITAPGIPDFYQGSETGDFTLVDPDNRRPVDFSRPAKLLRNFKARAGKSPLELIDDMLTDPFDGRLKLYTIATALGDRKQRPLLYSDGDYLPLRTSGLHARHVMAFARREPGEDAWRLTIVPRFLTDLVEEHRFPFGERVWQDTTVILPSDAPANWKNAFTSETMQAEEAQLMVCRALSRFPVALLIGGDNP